MITGDGLLVRLVPKGLIAIEAFVALCAAAGRHGNGLVEITSRGNLQVRGLSQQSAPLFAAAVAGLGIVDECVVPVIGDSLAHGPDVLIDTAAVVASLRKEIAAASLTLAPKISMTVDGGGRLHLDALSADLRLRAFMTGRGPRLHVTIGGDAQSATPLGAIAPDNAASAAVRLLRVITARGPTARAADVLRREGIAPFRSAISDDLEPAPALPARAAVEAIGQHRLRDGGIALGVALAFSQADTEALAQLARIALAHDALSARPAPGRVLLLSGLDQDDAAAIATAAAQLGFIVHADDPRRRIAACAGRPACPSGWIAARALAAEVAHHLPLRSGAVDIHISGCAKGCAHPSPAALTVVGSEQGGGIVHDGSARTTPSRYVYANNLFAEIMDAMRAKEVSHG
jgi:precorrin-3B synthase